MKKLLLTGHLGYLGSQFLQRYADIFEIVGYDLKEGDDILDYGRLKQKMQSCEQVVHLAAIPKPIEGRSFDDYFQINVEGTRNIARAAEELGLERIVYASSTTMYGVERGIPKRGRRITAMSMSLLKTWPKNWGNRPQHSRMTLTMAHGTNRAANCATSLTMRLSVRKLLRNNRSRL